MRDEAAPEVEALRRVPFFEDLTTEDLERLAAHLRDEQEFLQLAQSSTEECRLNSVSFVKPVGPENEHPGYTSESRGSNHLVELLKVIEGSKCKKNTMVIVAYDENGGQWDHDLQSGVAPDGWHCVALTLTGTPAFARAFAAEFTGDED